MKTIRVKNKDIKVSEEIFKGYWQEVRKEKYSKEKENKKIVLSYNALDKDDFLGEEILKNQEEASVEEIVIKRIEKSILSKAINELSKEEKIVIKLIFFEMMTEREVAKILNISQKNINKKKKAILLKLKNIISDKI